MSTNINAAVVALKSEIQTLAKQEQRLTQVLASLGDTTTMASKTTAVQTVSGKKRGRKPKAAKLASAEADLAKALELLKNAGKAGIKAIALAFQLKKAGHQPINKIELLATDKVKASGKGGGTTYAFKG